MPTNNCLNYSPNEFNVLLGDANGTITDVTPDSTGYVLTSNGASSNPTFQFLASSIGRINGDTGFISGFTCTFNSATFGAGRTVKFSSASATEMDLLFTDANLCVAIGNNAGSNLFAGATDCTFLGQNSGATISSANHNTAIGYFALSSSSNGDSCIALGASSLLSSSVGSGNISIGSSSLLYLTNGDKNIVIGQGAANDYTYDESSNIIIKNAGVSFDLNVIRIGNSTDNLYCYVAGIHGTTITGNAVLIDGNGQLGDISSSLKFKENITDIDATSNSAICLRPVSFNYKKEKEKTIHFGLIAEEAVLLFPELVIYKEEEIYSIKYYELYVLLLKEIQTLKNEIDEFKKLLGLTPFAS